MRHPPSPYPRRDDVPSRAAWTTLLPDRSSPVDEDTTEVAVITPASDQVAESADSESVEVAVEADQIVPQRVQPNGTRDRPEEAEPGALEPPEAEAVALEQPEAGPDTATPQAPEVVAREVETESPTAGAEAPEPASTGPERGAPPADAVYPPDAGPAPPPLRPGDVAEEPIAIWPGDQAQHFRDRWRDLQVLFIDEPDEAVASARALVTDAVRTLSDRLLTEQEEFDPRRDSERPDTESLRVAMRRYREFLERVLAL